MLTINTLYKKMWNNRHCTILLIALIATTLSAQRRTNIPLFEIPEQYRAYFPDYQGVLDVVAPTTSDDYEYFEEMIPSGQKGTRLLTRVYLPKGEGPHPVVVTRTPYVFMKDDYISLGREYARHGIGYIQQDCRGKGGSEGFFAPNVNERADGLALYRWLDEQPWCGEIGIFGSSYTALTGWIVGDSLPDKVKGMYLSHYGVDRHISCFRAGLFRQDIMSGWLIDNAEEEIRKPQRQEGQAPGTHYYDFYLYRPHVEADVQVLGQQLSYYRDWITHTDYTDPYWNSGVWADLKRVPALIDVPMTIVAGQFDHHEEGTILGFERLTPEVRSHSRLVLGAWNHSFEVTPTHTPHEHAKEFDITLDQFRWFYELLIQHRVPQQEVKVYNIEADRWENFDAWPLQPTELQHLYLTSRPLQSTQSNVLLLASDAPDTPQSVCYTYDPEHPIYAEGGETLFTSSAIRGCHPMSPAGYRQDLLSFVSEPLATDLTIGGEVKVNLRVRTDADDTAFAFTLCEVTPTGETYNMRTSIVTLGYRDGLLMPRVPYSPGEIVDIQIVALPMLWTVRQGNRLRLDIKSSQFPEYAVHANYAGVWANQSTTRPALQEVMVGGVNGSFIELPVVGKAAQ